MKKTLSIITAAAAALAANAQDVTVINVVNEATPADTVAVAVKTAPDDDCDQFCESDFNFEFPFSNAPFNKAKCSNPYNRFSCGITLGAYIGFVGTANDGVQPPYSMGRSYEGAFDRLITFGYQPARQAPKFSVSFGVAIKALTSKSGLMFTKEDDEWTDKVGVGAMPTGATDCKAQLSTTSLLIPFSIDQKLTRDLTLGLSAIMNMNTLMQVENKYKLDGEEITRKWRPYAARPISWDYMATLTYDGIGLYFKYSPDNIFNTGLGPKTTTLSFGLVTRW